MKSGKAANFPLAPEITPAMDFYLATIRPQLLGVKQHDYLFCKLNGDPPHETLSYSDWTKKVANELIGRPINGHAFRDGVIVTHYDSGATQAEMNQLADVMGHDPATARNHYYRADARKQALGIHERMRVAVAAPAAPVPDSVFEVAAAVAAPDSAPPGLESNADCQSGALATTELPDTKAVSSAAALATASL